MIVTSLMSDKQKDSFELELKNIVTILYKIRSIQTFSSRNTLLIPIDSSFDWENVEILDHKFLKKNHFGNDSHKRANKI